MLLDVMQREFGVARRLFQPALEVGHDVGIHEVNSTCGYISPVADQRIELALRDPIDDRRLGSGGDCGAIQSSECIANPERIA